LFIPPGKCHFLTYEKIFPFDDIPALKFIRKPLQARQVDYRFQATLGMMIRINHAGAPRRVLS
jgi:hypothetical protein